MYKYENERQKLFSDEGQRLFLAIRDRAVYLLKTAGAFNMETVIKAGPSSDPWLKIACVDRMVELKELREVPQKDCAGQHRVFVEPF